MKYLFMYMVAAIGLAAEETNWVTHYTAQDGGFQTVIELINTDFEQDHVVNLQPYASDGTILESAAREVTVAAGARLSLDRESLNWAFVPVSHLSITTDQAVRSSAAYNADIANALVAQVDTTTQAASTARLVPIADATWWDGIVALNTGETVATLSMTSHDAQGNTLRSTQTTIPAGGKWLAAASTVFEDQLNGQGYLEFRGDVPLRFLALRGSSPAVQPPVLSEARLDRYESPAANLTYSNQISRIIERKCGYCHYSGGIGPFPLQTFDEVHPMRTYLAAAVEDGLMPPWKAGENCGPLHDDMAIDPYEKELLLDWLMVEEPPEGNQLRAPAPVEYGDSEWQAGEPDLVLAYNEDFYFEPGPDVYRCFPMPLGNEEEFQISGLEVLPGNPEIVHHVLIFVSITNTGPQLDQQEEGPGYTCFGGPGTEDIRLLAGWAPGGRPTVMPDNVGMTIPANATLVVQVHYHYSGTTGSDRTRIGLHIADEERDEELLLLPLVNQNFTIPPGATDFEVTQDVTLPPGISAKLYGVAPHMHLLGKTISVQARYLDSSEQCLIDIPKWDFNWQGYYDYTQPIQLPSFTTLSLHCTFDNSELNPNNPWYPPREVGWGEETTDEMALAFLGLVIPGFSFKAESEQWKWPLSLERRRPVGATRILDGQQPKQPSCCKPGDDKKPWKKACAPGQPQANR